jgi:subfamily B ATP-binding cassette protein MsbA
MRPAEVQREFTTLRKLFSLTHCRLWFLLSMVVLGLLSSLFEGISLTLVIPLVHTLVGNGESGNTGHLVSLLQDGMKLVPLEPQLLAIVAAILIAVVLKAAVSYANMVVLGVIYGRLSHALRTGIFSKIVAMPLADVERERTGRLLNVLNNETWRATDALNTLFSMITSLCTLFVFVILLLILSWRLTLLALLCVAVVPPLIHLLTRRVKELSDYGLQANQNLAKRTWSALSGLRIIHAFGREGYETSRFRHSSDQVRQIFLRMALISMTTRPVTEVLITAIVAMLALAVDATKVEVATLFGFLAILYRLQPRVTTLVSARAALLGLHATVVEVTNILATPLQQPEEAGKRRFVGLREGIRVDGVTYAYQGTSRPALANVSFRIPRGGLIAIVGASGAGKSTVLDLLLCFHKPQKGRIEVDGQPLASFELASWRNGIGVVSQDPYIFDDTIRANILYGRPDASDTELAQAVRLACAHEFIAELPNGYDTVVGERGTQISGGQRQRLALARALIRNPEILVLDEATNALDPVTERAFQDALELFARDRTVIVVAHRLTMVEKASHVVVLDAGAVVEEGDPDTLLKANGIFARMYRLQKLIPPAV